MRRTLTAIAWIILAMPTLAHNRNEEIQRLEDQIEMVSKIFEAIDNVEAKARHNNDLIGDMVDEIPKQHGRIYQSLTDITQLINALQQRIDALEKRIDTLEQQ